MTVYHPQNSPGTGSFQLGPFLVVHYPWPGCPRYTRYSIQAAGKEIRAQISLPEEADGRLGYAAAVRDKKLTPEEQARFQTHCATLDRHLPSPLPKNRRDLGWSSQVYFSRRYLKKKPDAKG